MLSRLAFTIFDVMYASAIQSYSAANHRGVANLAFLVIAFTPAVCYLYYTFWLSVHQIPYLMTSFYDQFFVRIMSVSYLHFDERCYLSTNILAVFQDNLGSTLPTAIAIWSRIL